MKKMIFSLLCGSALLSAFCADYRPAFDKSSYKGTMWTQVNPWWFPAKQRVDELGGPNYAFKLHRGYEQWGSAFEDLCKDGSIGIQVELHVPAPGFAETMKAMMKQSRERHVNTKFAVFLVYYGKKDLESDIQKTIAQFDMLKEEFKNDPLIFRVDGSPVISVYTPDYFTPEEWGKVIPAVEAKCGKFIWLMNTCRGPAPDSDRENTMDNIRRYLPYFDGVSAYGNFTETSQQALDSTLSEIMHKEFPQKIYEASIQNAYSNHFHYGGVTTDLSKKWRKSVQSALEAKADSFVLTNFFDYYENSLILPCYEREDFLIRYAMAALDEWRGVKFESAKRPELVLTNSISVRLGEPLHFEVIGFPFDGSTKEITLKLEICSTSGKVLYLFPERKMNLSKLSTEVYEIPSETFSGERAVAPRLKYTWIGREKTTETNPETVIDPAMRTNLMFWARSTRNALECDVIDPEWSINGVPAGGTLSYPENGSVVVKSAVKCVFGGSSRAGGGTVHLMRNGLEWYSHRERDGGMNFIRAFDLPSPADGLDRWHLELENENGFRYRTQPVWITRDTRKGTVKMPVLCGKEQEIRTLEIESARVPFYWYPCDRDEGTLLVDRSGYLHNGRINGDGYGGGHLGFTGYHHLHNGPVDPAGKTLFRRDSDGRGMLHFSGKDYIMIHGGTAFPGASTYEISVRPEAFGKRMGLFGSVNRFTDVTIEPDGSVRAGRNGKSVVSRTRLKAGEWNRIAVVYDLKELVLYLDGVREGSVAVEPNKDASINHVTVGCSAIWLFDKADYFTGDLRDIRIYGRNLAENELLKQNGK